nr:zinc finger, CCHC-type [Tanacetum cinerariifolium]
MKDMGEADVILGIKIKRKIKGTVITQSHYIEKMLRKFNHEDCSSVSTSVDPVENLMLNAGKLVDQLKYSRAIGCLIASTLAKDYSQIYDGKYRHLGVRHSMIRELFMNGVISIEFVQSQHNLADHLTKDLARDFVIKFMIIAGADNRPPMLEKYLYDSWNSQDGTTRKKTYAKLSASEKLQADYDCKATNIVLQGLPPDVYAIFNHHKVAKAICHVVPVFNQRDDPIACLNKAMAFLTAVASLRFPSTNNQLSTSSNPRNQATIQDEKRPRNVAWFKEKAMLDKAQEAGQILDEEQLAFLADPSIQDGQAVLTTISNNATFQTKDLDAYDSDCDDVSNAKAVLMANISNHGFDVISE